MSDESVQPEGDDTDNTPQGEQQQATPNGAADESDKGEFDWKAQARKNEAALKREREARKELEAKVKGLLTPEEVQTERQMVDAAKREAEAAKAEALRFKIALAEGLPVDLAERLRGNDEDELREDAARLKAWVKTSAPAADAKKAALGQPPAQPVSPDDLLRQIIASR